jgi:hypothetical protein
VSVCVFVSLYCLLFVVSICTRPFVVLTRMYMYRTELDQARTALVAVPDDRVISSRPYATVCTRLALREQVCCFFIVFVVLLVLLFVCYVVDCIVFMLVCFFRILTLLHTQH